MSEHIEAVVIGAGAIGLAVARALALEGREVLVLEKHSAIGTETSSRNSEVIHAGIYYAKDSLKARLCVRGKELLYDYCASHGVPHKRIGKLIVACSEDEVAGLSALQSKARANGVDDTVILDQSQVEDMEPAVRAKGGLYSPSTGIIDSHAFMLALCGDLEDAGGSIALSARLVSARVLADGIELTVRDEATGVDNRLKTEVLINSAGLGAWDVAGAIEGFPPSSIPPRWLSKGQYFTYAGASPVNHLIYPLPSRDWLGIHATLDMGGGLRFGPDAHPVDEIDYAVDGQAAHGFAEAIRRYLPGIEVAKLQPGCSGIRPKLEGPDEPPGDFRIDGPAAHGARGLVNLFGIDSPGLTASLAIAKHVGELLD